MTDILVADDEKPLANFLLRGLKAEGYTCESVNDLHALLPALRQSKPQVLILDRMFGEEDSLDTLSAIKSLPYAPMVLMLTALDEIDDRVAGLTAGADDYLCKPFDFEELLARVIALKRRHAQTAHEPRKHNSFILGNLTLKGEERIALLSEEELGLTKIEFDLLLFLVEKNNTVLSRERILARVWDASADPQTNVVDVYISRLRKKLESDCALSIETLRGSGYRLKYQS